MWAAILTGGACSTARRELRLSLSHSHASFTYGGLLGGFFLGRLGDGRFRRCHSRNGDGDRDHELRCFRPTARAVFLHMREFHVALADCVAMYVLIGPTIR